VTGFDRNIDELRQSYSVNKGGTANYSSFDREIKGFFVIKKILAEKYISTGYEIIKKNC
jgi:hypothetical protein